ncbi:hypothetical protein MTP99_013473 [Tenebrio molitor]|jgi:hypothetical protein|nr:hypothetical protein MTP99_013473 [Tenebrio molitor]
MHVRNSGDAKLPDYVMVPIRRLLQDCTSVDASKGSPECSTSRLENPQLIIVETDLIVCMQSKHLRHSVADGVLCVAAGASPGGETSDRRRS